MANLHAVFIRVYDYKAAGGTMLLDLLATDEKQAAHTKLLSEYQTLEEEYAGRDESPTEIDTRLRVLEADMEKVEGLPLIFNPTNIGRAGAFVTLDRYGALVIYRGYDHLTSDDTWKGSNHHLQNIQNVCIFCTNGDRDHA